MNGQSRETCTIRYTRHKTKTNKTKSTAQYMLDTTIHKTQDEGKQNKMHNTICVGHNHIQDTRRRQTKQNAQHNMCWTPPCTRQKTEASKIKCTTDTTIHKTQDEGKQNKNKVLLLNGSDVLLYIKI